MTDVKKERFEKVIKKMAKRKWKYRMIDATFKNLFFWIGLAIVVIVPINLNGSIRIDSIILYMLIEVVLFGNFYWCQMQSDKMDMFKEAGL